MRDPDIINLQIEADWLGSRESGRDSLTCNVIIGPHGLPNLPGREVAGEPRAPESIVRSFVPQDCGVLSLAM